MLVGQLRVAVVRLWTGQAHRQGARWERKLAVPGIASGSELHPLGGGDVSPEQGSLGALRGLRDQPGKYEWH